MPPILVDTGPIVAYLDRRDQYHKWSLSQFSRLPAPYKTCEAVCVEAVHILSRAGLDPDVLLALIQLGVLEIDFAMKTDVERIRALMKKYRDQPMSLADACLVRMAERHPGSTVLTLDADFHIYRKHKRDTIPVIMP